MNKRSFKKTVLRSFLQNLTGGGINTAASILSGYFFALFLGPAVYGVWQTARIFLSYGTFTSLGIPFVIRRDFIMLRAEGRTAEADKMAHVGMTYSFIVNPIIALVFFAIAFFSQSETAFKISLAVVGIIYITSLCTGIANLLLKGFNDYKTLAMGDVINGIGMLVLVGFVYIGGYYALLAGYLALSIVSSAYFYVKRPLPYKWVWDFPLLKKMVFTAFPIFLVTIISTVFGSIDRLLIAGLLNFKEVGLYSLSTFIAQPITLLLGSFSIVLFTHLNQRYGSSKAPDVLDKHVYIPQLFFSKLLPPIIGMGVIALPYLTEVFLPRYSGGIMAAQINVFSILFINLAGFSSNGLFVLDKQKYTALSFFIAGCLKTTGSYFVLKAGYGIVGVAVFTLISYFAYNVMMLYCISISLGNGAGLFFKRLFESLVCPLAILAFCTFYLSYLSNMLNISLQNPFLEMAVGLLLVILIGSVFLYKAFKEIESFLID